MAAPKKSTSSTRRTSPAKADSQARATTARRMKARGEQDQRSVPAAKAPRKVIARTKPGSFKKKVDENHCASCGTDLRKGERALFVEEEVSRVFCTEECIATYFSPDIEALERDFQRHRQKARDLTDEERESFAHLRWVTLEQPDEIWREKTASGDWRYTLISEFQPGERRVWCIAICLFLRGEPSFLFLAIPTRDPALVGHYRRGDRLKRTRVEPKAGDDTTEESDEANSPALEVTSTAAAEASSGTDGLADSWTDEETIRAKMRLIRSKKDIPEGRFEEFEASMGQTLEAPDEVWSTALTPATVADEEGDEEDDAEEAEASGDALRLYHFIKAYSEESPPYWYVVIARDTQEEGQIEVLDSFPTTDPKLVETLRIGTHEYGENEAPAYSRLVH